MAWIQTPAADRVLLAVAALAFAVAATLIQARRLERLEPGSIDLALYAQGLWNAGHGRWWSSVQQAHFAGVHFAPLTFALAPLARLAGAATPLLLVAVQGVALGLSGLLVAELARPRAGRLVALGAGLVTLGQPALWALALADFHDAALGCPLALLLALALERGVTGGRLAAVALVAALLASEVYALVVAGAAVTALVAGRRRDAALLASIGAVTFAVTNFLVLRSLRVGALDVGSRYAHWSDPDLALRALPWRESLGLGLWLFAPLALLPLAGARALAPAAIPFALHVASSFAPQRSIDHHYHAPITPFVLAAFAVALGRAPRALGLAALATAVAAALPASPVRRALLDARPPSPEEALHRALAARVPGDAKVVASVETLHLLVARPWLWNLPAAIRGTKDWSRVPYELPDDLDAALVDELDDGTWSSPLIEDANPGHPLVRARSERWEALVLDRGLGLDATVGSRVLLRRGAPRRAVEEAPLPPGPRGPLPALVSVAREESPVGVGLALAWARPAGPLAPLYVRTSWPGGESRRPLLHRCFRARPWPEGRALVEHVALPVREPPRAIEVRLYRLDPARPDPRVAGLEEPPVTFRLE